VPEIGSLKNVATISHIALPTGTKDTLSGSFQRRLEGIKRGQWFEKNSPREARQPNISSFSVPSYRETSKMPFLIVSDTLYPATETVINHFHVRTPRVTASVLLKSTIS
jgi:hypothetical protein